MVQVAEVVEGGQRALGAPAPARPPAETCLTAAGSRWPTAPSRAVAASSPKRS